jgi:hypothetical protein
MFGQSRRDVVRGMAAVTMQSAISSERADASQQETAKYPRDVGRKFFADGRPRPFAGNTIISHLPQQGRGYGTFDAFLDIYRDLPVMGFARKISALPCSSYHMTVFGGANDQDRERGPWPGDVPIDTPIVRCNTVMAEHLAGFTLDCELPLRMRVDTDFPGETSPITVPLQPLDAREAGKLRRIRDKLADILHIRTADHDSYRYHVTIAYQVAWFTADEKREYAAAFQSWRSRLARACPVIELGAPEFCTFRDMFAFERKFLLGA